MKGKFLNIFSSLLLASTIAVNSEANAIEIQPKEAKLIRGYAAKKFFEFFPEAKRKYFWDSGLWNPSYYIGSPKNMKNTINYIRKQKYGEGRIRQSSLLSYAS